MLSLLLTSSSFAACVNGQNETDNSSLDTNTSELLDKCQRRSCLVSQERSSRKSRASALFIV